MSELRKSCIDGKLPPPVGTSDWATFSQECLCVDKTLMIKELADNPDTLYALLASAPCLSFECPLS